mmetsp:Transcript_7456/g.11039  ORF Transcript_7456/g.11039 Transcript_7456/m.11039 type:complete len:329 (-) Transcript_7456:45-1031(-)
MSTLSSKYTNLHDHDPNELYDDPDLSDRIAKLESRGFNEEIQARHFQPGSSNFKDRDMGKLKSEYVKRYGNYELPGAKEMSEQLKANKISNHKLREHNYEFGYDPSNRFKSLNREDFKTHDPNEYAKNKKNVKTIGSVTGPNNWFRSPLDIEDWKNNMVSSTHSDFHAKPVQDPFDLKAERDKTKSSNLCANHSMGSDHTPMGSSYKDSHGKELKTKTPAERRNEKDAINRQKKVLSQSSIMKTDNPAMYAYATEYQNTIAASKPIVGPNSEANEIRDFMLNSGIKLGSDHFVARTIYKTGYRPIVYEEDKFTDFSNTQMYYKGDTPK